MARFTQPIQPTQDPNYLQGSRAMSPYAAQSAPDTSLGKLFENVASLGGAAAKGIDTTIQENIRQDLYSGADAIRGQHGADTPPDQIPAVAGTGARGARYSATNPASLAGVSTDDALSVDAVPPQVNAQVQGLQKLSEAYKQGQLSDSYYYSQLESVAKQMYARYPGYREQIDQQMSQITGVTPANALRASTLRDMVSMQAALSSQDKQLQNRFHEDAKYFSTLYPGMSFDDYKKNPQAYDTQINTLKAQDYQIQSQKSALELAASTNTATAQQKEQSYTSEANQFVSVTMRSTLNQFQDKAQSLIAQGANANPKDMADFLAKAQILRQDMSNRINDIAVQPLTPGSSNSYSSLINNPTKLKQIQDAALAPIDSMIASIGAGAMGPANAAANIAKWQTNQDFVRLTGKAPAIRAYKAIGEIGPQFAGQVLELSKNAGLPELTKAVTDTQWMNTASSETKNPMPVSEQIGNALATHPVNPGKVSRVTVQGLQQLAGSPDPEVAFKAVQAIYGDKDFFANLADKEKGQVYQMLASPKFTQQMVELGKTKPEAFQMYGNWMEQNFPAVFKQGIDDLQSAVQFKHYDWSFNPQTMHFSATSKPDYQSSVFSDPAPEYVSKINSAIDVLRPVLKERYGNEMVPRLMTLLGANGFNPNAPQKGSFFEELNKTLQGYTGAPLGEPPAPTPPTKGGKISMEDTGAPAEYDARWKYAYDSFASKGWSPAQSAGIIGSLSGETSGLNPTQSHDNGIGLGIAGWNKDRLTALKQYAKDQNSDYKDVDTQLAFVDHELRTTEKAAGDRLRQATSPEEAAAIFTQLYERPGVPNTKARMGNAAGFYNKYASNP